MRVVSNTSPLIFLSKLGRSGLLANCFTEIYIPEAVQTELGALMLPDFVQTFSVSVFGLKQVEQALGVLHTGELQAMQLAQELQADLVLLDDLKARHEAKNRGLAVLGTLGVLQLAQAKGFLTKIELPQCYDDLVNQHGMWLSFKMLQVLKNQLDFGLSQLLHSH